MAPHLHQDRQAETKKYKLLSVDDARTALYSCKQGEHQATVDYYQLFRTLLDILEHHGGKIVEDPNLCPNITASDPDT